MRRSLLVLVLASALLPAQIDPALLGGLRGRGIGPAGMSGRVAALALDPGDSETLYVGAASGGLWRSTNGGLTFEPLFDDQPVASIGAVAITPGNRDSIWVGTGEGNPRNSASVGNGVYRSLDGGRTWRHLGLERSERIHRIVLHPADPDVAWVAALGPAWRDGGQRGVFKTTDGGRTWRRVLGGNPRTGCADLAIDPANPDHLLAALWEYRRWPWFFRSGGPGSGLWASHDGGETWVRRTHEDGLPEGDIGRIGLAFAPSEPRIVYALVEAKKSALLRSKDGGRTFETVNEDPDVAPRPFYFSNLRVDPERPLRIYSLHSKVSVSEDGGKTFRTLVPFRDVHPDHHAMVIDPRDPERIFLGNDGGVYESRDRGETWRFCENLPLAQLYHVRVDRDTPYHIYFGLQDNGSWRGPSAVWENGGIRNHHWQEVNFGDGFDTIPDPRDSMQGYAMSQQGYLIRWNLRTGERKSIRPDPPADGELRFNWNAGIAIDPFDPDTIWFGSQFVHRSRDRGETWEILSEDLTSATAEWLEQGRSGGLTPDVTGAENYCSIVAIAPSPIARGVVWVGTDDGRLWLTRDDGGSWQSLEANLEDAPEGAWIAHIQPSWFDPDEAFVVLDDHRRGDEKPYLMQTTDHGQSWRNLAKPSVRGYALSVAQDPVRRELLWLGTEFGLWVSLDGGAHWTAWRHGLPAAPVRDLVVHPSTHDLVIGTHGRAVWILDDVRPLRELVSGEPERPLHVFPIADAQQYRVRQTDASRFPGHGEFRGSNRPYGAIVSFWSSDPTLPVRPASEDAVRRAEKAKDAPKVKVHVEDAKGRIIRRFERPAWRGLNRFVWNLRRDAFRRPPRSDRERSTRRERSGPEVVPGTYTVVIQRGQEVARAAVRVRPDPRLDISHEDRLANERAVLEAGALQERATAAIERIRDLRADVNAVLRKARAAGQPAADGEGPHAKLIEAGERLLERLDAVEKLFWHPPGTRGIPPSKTAMDRIGRAASMLGSSWDAPTPAQLGYLSRARRTLDAALAALETARTEDVAKFRAAAKAAGLALLESPR